MLAIDLDAIAGNDIGHTLGGKPLSVREQQLVLDFDSQDRAVGIEWLGDYLAVNLYGIRECVGRFLATVGMIAAGPESVDEKGTDIVAILSGIKFVAVELNTIKSIQIIGHALTEVDDDFIAPLCRLGESEITRGCACDFCGMSAKRNGDSQ